MKKIILLTIVALTITVQLYAQNDKGKIEELKIAFITQRLQLTPEEAQKFWPVYNQYEAEKREIRNSTIGKVKDLKDDDNFTNEQAEAIINKQIEFKTKDLELTKKYVVEFKKVLPTIKVAKLVTAEEHFKKMLTKQAQQGGPKPGGPQAPKPWRQQGE